MTVKLNQDIWNHIFSYTGLTGLRGAVRTSKDNFLLIAINQYATTILLSFKLEVDNPTLSFKRLSNFQNLIDQWFISGHFFETPANYLERKALEIEEFFNFRKKMYEDKIKKTISKKKIHLFKYHFKLYDKGHQESKNQIAALKEHVIKNLTITDCTSLNFKDCLIPLNNTSEFIAYLSPIIFPDHAATKDLTLFFLQNSESALFALEHKEYEKLKEFLEKNYEMINENYDCFEELILASLANKDFKSFEIVLESLEKYINENLNKENKIIHLLKLAKYYPFINGNKHEAFCKLWHAYKEDIREWTRNTEDIGNIAVRNNDIELLTALKKLSYNFNDHHILHEAKTIEAAKILIEGGADIHKQNYFKETTLLSAIKNKNLQVAQFLLDKGADFNQYNQNFDRPIDYIKDCETLQLFLPKIKFLALFEELLAWRPRPHQFGRPILKEIVYRMRYILLAAVIIPAIYIGVLGLNVI